MEKAVIWAIQKVVEEDIDDSLAMAALLGGLLDSATFLGLGFSPGGAAVAGAITGAGIKACKNLRKGEET